MDPTQPRWAPLYAARLPLIAHLPAPDHLNPNPSDEPARAAWDAPFGPAEVADVEAENQEIDGPHGPIPVRVYRPRVSSGIGLVWYHGGAFVGGDLDVPEADLVARGLADRAGAVVISVDYRLCVNGVQHPQPHDDAYAAFRWTVDNAEQLGIHTGRVAVGGASAGGCLAGTVAIHGRADGVSPSRALLAYPLAHPAVPPDPECEELMSTVPPLLRLSPDMLRTVVVNYAGVDPARGGPYAFPGLARDLAGHCPTYIENSELDDLRPSGELYAVQLAEAGVNVTVHTAPGVPHGHLNAVGSPYAKQSLDRFSAQLGRLHD